MDRNTDPLESEKAQIYVFQLYVKEEFESFVHFFFLSPNYLGPPKNISQINKHTTKDTEIHALFFFTHNTQ